MSVVQRWWTRWRLGWLKTDPPDWKSALAILVSSILLWPLTAQLPMLGYDWRVYFWARDFNQYPDWAAWALAPLLILPWRSGLALLNALLLMTVAISVAREVYKQAEQPSASVTVEALGTALLALSTPPVLVLLWVGNIEALALFGMLIMPAGIIWLSLKPHLGVWAVLSRRSWIFWAIIFAGLMLMIWPGWPLKLLNSLKDRTQHPSAFGWAGVGWPMIVIGLVLLTQTSAEPLSLMAAGSFLSPFLMPQHFVLFLPALGRVRGPKRIMLWAASWLLVIPLIGGWFKFLALGFPLLVWLMLRQMPTEQRRPGEIAP